MAQADFLEDWMDSIEALPTELQRNYSEIKQLDGECQKNLDFIQRTCKEFTQNHEQMTVEDKKKVLKSLNETFRLAIKESEDKVQLAVQTFDLVDQQIRRLDEDLGRFEDELTITGIGLVDQIQPSQKSQQNSKGSKKRSRKEKEVQQNVPKPARRRDNAASGITRAREEFQSPSEVPELPNFSQFPQQQTQPAPRQSQIPPPMYEEVLPKTRPHPDAPADPNEPTYCICNQVSYGAMIGCDNEDCDIEWFHYECVGLTSPPTGKWYCPNCRKKLNLV